MIKKSFFIFLFVLSVKNLYPQGIESNLSKVGELYAEQYVKPGIDGIGANLNSGFFNTASVPYNKLQPVSFNFNFSLRLFGSFFSESERSFNLTYQDSVEQNGIYRPVTYTVTNAPTIIGNTNDAVAYGYFDDTGEPADPQELIGGLVNTSVVPLFFPQFQIGSIYGTDAVIRFLPKVDISDIGSISFFGFAIRHNLDHYFPESPFNFAVQAGYQTNEVQDVTSTSVFSGNDFFINLQASKSFTPVFTLYGGLQLEKFSGDINYTYIQDGTSVPVSFTQTADNKFRVILGANLTFGVFNFNLDGNISNRFSLSSGFGVGF